ncbi:hypothetical protein [Poritiphilus flavus]|uniref:Uncharacterized protein n=1 Tax=Poritiphilus flavus TaxID=2697053 RepID=A0A6L9E9V7_9FLAO|nr:hypothetical protein [Poritiphilus flavus]NAS11342.1 hypothetical protein [Poritiphilus flavus]
MKSLKFAAFFFMASFITSAAVALIPVNDYTDQNQTNHLSTVKDGVLYQYSVRAQLDSLTVLEMDADAATAYVESLSWIP